MNIPEMKAIVKEMVVGERICLSQLEYEEMLSLWNNMRAGKNTGGDFYKTITFERKKKKLWITKLKEYEVCKLCKKSV